MIKINKNGQILHTTKNLYRFKTRERCSIGPKVICPSVAMVALTCTLLLIRFFFFFTFYRNRHELSDIGDGAYRCIYARYAGSLQHGFSIYDFLINIL